MHCGSFGVTDRYLCFVYSKGRDRLNIAENYLTGMPSELCNKHGLSKTLLTRRETIRLKHLMKSLFVYRIFTDEELDEHFNVMQFKGLSLPTSSEVFTKSLASFVLTMLMALLKRIKIV